MPRYGQMYAQVCDDLNVAKTKISRLEDECRVLRRFIRETCGGEFAKWLLNENNLDPADPSKITSDTP